MQLGTEAYDPNVSDASALEPVDCSVLVPAYNEERHIQASVEAMLAQRFPGRLEFLIVDGGSTDRTPAIVRELALRDRRIRLLTNPRRVTPSGLNVALGWARGRWVARMDAHTEYRDDYLKQGVERLGNGGTRWVSGLAVAHGQGEVSRAVALALKGPLGRGGSRKWVAEQGPDREYELDSGVFAGVWERSTLLEYGGWDEHWRRNQDSEMAGRFLARGEKLVLVPAMAAAYSPRDSVPALWRQYYGYGVYRTRTAARHPHTMRRSHVLAPGIALALVMSSFGRTRASRVARAGVSGYLVALGAAAIRAVPDAVRPIDAALVPVVLATMHLSYGTGAWIQAARTGPPLAAIARICGLNRLAERLAPAPSEVYAPSLAEALRESMAHAAADVAASSSAD
jgi:glycosyltransferase involved in cell wall biosynthesis